MRRRFARPAVADQDELQVSQGFPLGTHCNADASQTNFEISAASLVSTWKSGNLESGNPIVRGHRCPASARPAGFSL